MDHAKLPIGTMAGSTYLVYTGFRLIQLLWRHIFLIYTSRQRLIINVLTSLLVNVHIFSQFVQTLLLTDLSESGLHNMGHSDDGIQMIIIGAIRGLAKEIASLIDN